MNKQRITEIIAKPENLNYDSDYPLVRELIDSFPYFSTPYVMLSKMLHDENSIYFDHNDDAYSCDLQCGREYG